MCSSILFSLYLGNIPENSFFFLQKIIVIQYYVCPCERRTIVVALTDKFLKKYNYIHICIYRCCTQRGNNAQKSTNVTILVCRIITERKREREKKKDRLFITILFIIYHPAFRSLICIALK